MARELSPFSARRLLTQQLALPPRNQTRSRSRERTCDTREKERRPRDASPDRELKDAPPPRGRGRDRSPEPFKRPRPSSRDEKRDRSRDTRRERQGRRNQSTERKRSRSADRRRHRSRDRRRERSTEDRSSRRHGSRSGDWKRRDRDGDRDRDRDGDGDGDGDRHRHRHRDGDRHRHRDTDTDRDRDRHRHRDRSRHRPRNHRTRSASTSSSPPPKRRRRTPTRSASPRRRTKTPLPPQELSFRGLDNSHQPPSKYGGAPPSKEKPNFKPTGALALAANRVQGTNISLKYHEPPEARKPPPSQPWRIFVFKGNDVIDTLELWQKSCWLLGRSQHVVDYLLEHPSSSAQHAVIQFRYVHKTLEDDFGVRTTRGKVKPYIIDLESSNGTELNGEPIESSRYFELRDKDILTFAGSEREYVVMLPPPEAAT